ncbi:MAG: hypothetical protein AMS18_12865 [Gemmatimonas sp. SG8_17]|nr:MAG: hypothetical protein AMS18_12865 [Gemmatimonas sp. SG8_17]
MDLSNYTILVVDDEPDSLTFIGTVLRDGGATVIEARDGEEALKLARSERPDLVTLDISMPGKDGAEVFEEMRGDSVLKSIPVCIVSGQPELRRLIYQRTVPPPDGYVDKPIDEERLLFNIRKILSLSRRAR